jgi:hypothetical protein
MSTGKMVNGLEVGAYRASKAQLAASQSRDVLSPEAVTTRDPSGLKAALPTQSVWLLATPLARSRVLAFAIGTQAPFQIGRSGFRISAGRAARAISIARSIWPSPDVRLNGGEVGGCDLSEVTVQQHCYLATALP